MLPPADEQQTRAMPWFLAHVFLNAIFACWTFGGSVFLLFLDQLGMPKGQIGVLLSLFPFSGVLALWFAPVAAHLGWKRVFIAGYGVRKLVMALLLFLPWVLTAAGQKAGMVFVFAVITVFALLRAMAETAYYPWSQEFIPNRMRGKIAGVNMLLGTVSAGVALWIAGLVIGHGAGLPRFLVLIAAGCLVGLAGILMMVKVPGGSPRTEPAAADVHGANMARALRDRNFLACLGGTGCVTIGIALFTSFLPLYLKERLEIASGTVVMLDIVVTAGGAVAGLLLGWAADRVGSRPVLMPATAVSLLVPLGWLLLPRHMPHAVAWCAALYFVSGVSSTGVGIASSRLLFNSVIPREHSTAYTAILYAWNGVTGGIAPLLAGALLAACGDWQTRVGMVVVDAHSLLFVAAALLTAAGLWLYGRVKPDDRYTTRGVLNALLASCLAVTLGRRRVPASGNPLLRPPSSRALSRTSSIPTSSDCGHKAERNRKQRRWPQTRQQTRRRSC